VAENFSAVKIVVPSIPSSAAHASIASLNSERSVFKSRMSFPSGIESGVRSFRAPVPIVTFVTAWSLLKVVSPVSASSFTSIAFQLVTISFKSLKRPCHQ
jgi:hypothetical protein